MQAWWECATSKIAAPDIQPMGAELSWRFCVQDDPTWQLGSCLSVMKKHQVRSLKYGCFFQNFHLVLCNSILGNCIISFLESFTRQSFSSSGCLLCWSTPFGCPGPNQQSVFKWDECNHTDPRFLTEDTILASNEKMNFSSWFFFPISFIIVLSVVHSCLQVYAAHDVHHSCWV